MKTASRRGMQTYSAFARSGGGVLRTEDLSGGSFMEPERMTLSVEEAAAALGISRALAYELVRRGELPRLRLGRRIVVPRRALEDLVASAARAAESEQAS